MNRVLKANRHSVYSLKYHLVVITKYRKKCLTNDLRVELKKIFTRLLKKKNGEVLEFGGEEDHIHILFEIPPQIKLSQQVNTLKTVSSRLINRDHRDYLKKYYVKSTLWSRSYCLLTTGGATIETIKRYIENQGKK